MFRIRIESVPLVNVNEVSQMLIDSGLSQNNEISRYSSSIVGDWQEDGKYPSMTQLRKLINQVDGVTLQSPTIYVEPCAG